MTYSGTLRDFIFQTFLPKLHILSIITISFQRRDVEIFNYKFFVHSFISHGAVERVALSC